MCGIAGITRQGGASAREPVDRMVAALAHRGPDSNGVIDLGECTLGNTRLAIVDLSEHGRQPMCNEDSTVWITYNGECYNAAEFRQELTRRGHQFRSATDTEVILHLYEEYGEGCVEKLRGMFAFAIWDSRARKLLLARDRLGIKPLYYVPIDGGIAFASEIKALLASEIVPHKLDAAACRVFLELGHIPPPWTILENARPLEPGHWAVWKDEKLQFRAYWKLPMPGNGRRSVSSQTIAQPLGDLLLDSCRAQLMSDVPIALFLSGGIDSAVLGALMRRAGADQLTALTIGFEEKQFDESAGSERTARLLGIPSRVIRLSASEMEGSLDRAIWAMDQPTVDGLNAFWISLVAAQAGFKVALSGQGGDELFGGYESLAWFDRFSSAAGWLRPFPNAVGRGILDHQAFPFRWRKISYLVGADDPFVAAQLAVRLLFLETDVRELLSPALSPPNSHSEAADCIREWADETKGQSPQDRIAWLDFPAHLEARLLRDGDAMSMAHSLEVRPVLLDHQVVQFVMSLPASLRLQKKKLLLDAVRGGLPAGLFDELSTRPKKTFTFPFASWLSGRLRNTLGETFSAERLTASGVFRPEAIRRLWTRYIAKPESVGWSRIWSVFVLARWCELMRIEV